MQSIIFRKTAEGRLYYDGTFGWSPDPEAAYRYPSREEAILAHERLIRVHHPWAEGENPLVKDAR